MFKLSVGLAKHIEFWAVAKLHFHSAWPNYMDEAGAHIGAIRFNEALLRCCK